MLKAKSKGLISLLALLVVSLIMALFVFTGTTAYAASPDASRYFSYKTSAGSAISGVKFENNAVTLPLKVTEEIGFSRAMVIDDYLVAMSVPVDEVKEFTYNVPMSSFIATGNKNADGKFDATIENKVKFTVNASDFTVTLNGQTATVPFNSNDKNFVEIAIKVENNVVSAKVNGTAIPVATDDYYKVRIADKPISNMSISLIDLKDGVNDTKFILNSVNTKATATDSSEYQQSFQLDATGSGFNKYARPRYVVNEGFISKDGKVLVGEEYTVSTTAYSMMGTVTTCYLTTDELDGVTVFGSAKKNIKFTKEGTFTFNISVVDSTEASGYRDYEAYTVTAVKEGRNGDGNAPQYTATAEALESFKVALDKALFKDYENKVFIGLGSDQYLNLPSFESLVSDDASAYKNLTYTIYYKSPDSSSTYSSGYKIPVAKAGKYSFYVVFKDRNGNQMNASDFISDESKPLEENTAPYKDYVFEFEIFDNAELSALAREQGTAYVGIKYTATNFKVVASDNTKTYKLYYSTTGANGSWNEVVKASVATDEDESYNGISYEDVKAINFTGDITFTPHAEGFYRLDCIVNSSSSTRWIAAEAVIEAKTPTTVGTAQFASNANVPQIIFLAVGGVCFAGIIALFFVKPKNKNED